MRQETKELGLAEKAASQEKAPRWGGAADYIWRDQRARELVSCLSSRAICPSHPGET